MSEAKTIYLLQEFGGQWEDAWKCTLLASFDQQRLEKIAADKRVELARMKAASEKYYEYMEQWDEANPAPDVPEDPDLLSVPRWMPIAGQKQIITDEMRQERRDIQAENERRLEVARGPWQLLHDDWAARRSAALGDWELEHSCVGAGKRGYEGAEGYRVEAVAFME